MGLFVLTGGIKSPASARGTPRPSAAAAAPNSGTKGPEAVAAAVSPGTEDKDQARRRGASAGGAAAPQAAAPAATAGPGLHVATAGTGAGTEAPEGSGGMGKRARVIALLSPCVPCS
jgi:hypothetical protein